MIPRWVSNHGNICNSYKHPVRDDAVVAGCGKRRIVEQGCGWRPCFAGAAGTFHGVRSMPKPLFEYNSLVCSFVRFCSFVSVRSFVRSFVYVRAVVVEVVVVGMQYAYQKRYFVFDTGLRWPQTNKEASRL